MKKLTLTNRKLKSLRPCGSGYLWYKKQDTTDLVAICDRLLVEHPHWASWLISRLLSRKDKISYAIFAAEQVIDIFEKRFPQNTRPREAINAAKKYLKFPTAKNKKTADAAYAATYAAAYGAAADAAYAAADAAYGAAANAAYAAANAAYAAAYAAANAAYAAANAAYAAADAAYGAAANAAYAAADAATTAREEMQRRIVSYGLKLLSRAAKGEG